MTRPRPIICAVCRTALDTYADDEGLSYIHAAHVADPDHEPQPIEAPDDWRGHCDFCLTGVAAWVIPARTFTTPLTGHLSAEDWAACDTCVDLIAKDQWNALVRRVVTATCERHPEMAPEDIQTPVKALYRALRKHITGAPRPL